MTAVVIPFPVPVRRTEPCPPPPLPLVVQAHPGAVALLLPDTEWWLTADQARGLAADLLAAAEDAGG